MRPNFIGGRRWPPTGGGSASATAAAAVGERRSSNAASASALEEVAIAIGDKLYVRRNDDPRSSDRDLRDDDDDDDEAKEGDEEGHELMDGYRCRIVPPPPITSRAMHPPPRFTKGGASRGDGEGAGEGEGARADDDEHDDEHDDEGDDNEEVVLRSGGGDESADASSHHTTFTISEPSTRDDDGEPILVVGSEVNDGGGEYELSVRSYELIRDDATMTTTAMAEKLRSVSCDIDDADERRADGSWATKTLPHPHASSSLSGVEDNNGNGNGDVADGDCDAIDRHRAPHGETHGKTRAQTPSSPKDRLAAEMEDSDLEDFGDEDIDDTDDDDDDDIDGGRGNDGTHHGNSCLPAPSSSNDHPTTEIEDDNMEDFDDEDIDDTDDDDNSDGGRGRDATHHGKSCLPASSLSEDHPTTELEYENLDDFDDEDIEDTDDEDDDDGGRGSLQRAAALSIDDESAFGAYSAAGMEEEKRGTLQRAAALSADDDDDDEDDRIFDEVYDRILHDRHQREMPRLQPERTSMRVFIPSLMDMNSASSSFSVATMIMTTPSALPDNPADHAELEDEEGGEENEERKESTKEEWGEEEPRDYSPPSPTPPPQGVVSMVDDSLTGGLLSYDVDTIDNIRPPLPHHRSDYIVDLDKIDEGGGSEGPSDLSRSASKKEEKEPLKQFYDYRHRFYNEQYHYFDDSRFSSYQQGSGNADDDGDVQSSCSSVTLSEAFEQLRSDGDEMSDTSSLTEEYYPRDRMHSYDSRVSQQPSFAHSPSYSQSLISTVSSVTLSRALDEDLERHEHHTRGFYVATRLGDFVEDVIVPPLAEDDVPGAEEYINDDGYGVAAIRDVGETNDLADDGTDLSSEGGAVSSNVATKKTPRQQIASPVLDAIGSDILDLMPECGVPIPAVMAQAGTIRARSTSKGGMLLPWHSARSIQNYQGRRGAGKKGGDSSSRSIFSISSVHSFRG